ncbi:MAG: dUTP diphosphatase [Bacteroidota bacterium]
MSADITVRIINRSSNPLPAYATPASAGVDLYAHLEQPLVLESLDRALVPTGIFIELPLGYEAQIRPRSGLAYKHGLTLLNTPGTIDADYRGEIKVLIINLSRDAYTIEPGLRLAQMVIAQHAQVKWEPVDALSETVRGVGGFGHTGTN